MSKHLYIIHGWTYTTTHWQKTLVELSKQGITASMLQVPGLTTPSEKVWNINDYVQWLKKELVNVKDPIILGHSNGGRIALNYLAKYPSSFKHLILLNSAGINVNNQSVSLKRKVFKLLSKLLGPLKHVPLLRKFVYKLLGSGDYNKAPANMKRTLQNMLSSDALLDPTQIKVPTTILWGGKDKTTITAQGEKLHNLIPLSTFKIVEDWGHAPYITHPTQLTQEIVKIFKGIQ